MENGPQSPVVPVGGDGELRNIPVVSGFNQNQKPRKIHLNPKFFAPGNNPLANGVNNQLHTYNQSNKFNRPFPPRFPPHHSSPYHRFPPHHPPTNHLFNPPEFQSHWSHTPPPQCMPRQPCAPFQSSNFYRPNTPQQNYFTGFNSQPPNPWLQPESAPHLELPAVPNVEGWQDGQPYPEQPDPIPGPSYYNAFNEFSNELVSSYADTSSSFHLDTATKDGHHDPRFRRSRSRSSYSSARRSHHTRSHSAGSRRSRSLSSHYRRSRSQSSSSSKYYRCRSSELSRSDDDDESVLNSNYEVNSDSDLDLSKSLSLLSQSVCDTRALLSDTYKCLGSSKFKSMMPTECSNFSKGRLFRMLESILDSTDNEILVRIMEGKRVELENPSSSSSVTRVKDSDATNCEDIDSESESDEAPTRKLHRKKQKRKKKRRKKSKRQETEAEDESLESDTEVAQPDLPSYPSNLVTGPHSTATTASVTQQSLLELIHIEYKTKAINVMLKNLGVASDITNLVSNALTAEGSNAAQILAALRSSNIDGVIQNLEDISSPGSKQDFSEKTPNTNKTIESHSLNNVTEIPKSTDNIICDLSAIKSTGDDSSQNKVSPLASVAVAESNELEVDNRAAVLANEVELFKEIDNDVLDLGVGANDNLKFPEDV